MKSPVIHTDWGSTHFLPMGLPFLCTETWPTQLSKNSQKIYPPTRDPIPYCLRSRVPFSSKGDAYNHGKSMFLLQCLPPRSHQPHRMVQWPLKDAAECHLGEDALLRWGTIFKEVIYTLNQWSLYGDIFSIGRRMELGAKRCKQKWTQLS